MNYFIAVRNLSSLIQRLFFSRSFTIHPRFSSSHLSCSYSFKALTHPAVILLKLCQQCSNLQLEPSVSLSGIKNTGFINSPTNSKAKLCTSKTTLGIVFDDPKDPSAITDKILHHFNCGKSCAQSTTCIPHCTFITSINDDCL